MYTYEGVQDNKVMAAVVGALKEYTLTTVCVLTL